MRSVQCIAYSAQHTMHNAQCTERNVHYIVCSDHCTLYSIQCPTEQSLIRCVRHLNEHNPQDTCGPPKFLCLID